MGTLLEMIKDDSLKARKEKDTIKAALLITLYSEALMVGKNKRNAEPTNEETLGTIQKFIKNATEVKDISVARGLEIEETKARKELDILFGYIPSQLTDGDLNNIIEKLISSVTPPLNLGQVMTCLKKDYSGKYDGKMASEIAKKLIGTV